ncbi:MAG: glycoside hydrolase family 73 protein [Candidatus Acidiferrales bacterium]
MHTPTQDERDKFIAAIAPAAKAAAAKWGVPASVTIAQAILETAWGTDALSRTANNFFGVKWQNDSGEPFVEKCTREFLEASQLADLERHRPWVKLVWQVGEHVIIRDRFRVFASPAEAFAERGDLIASNNRYAPAMAVAHNGPAFAQALQKCGWATDPNYAAELEKLMSEFGLEKYDVPPAPPTASAAAA